MLREALEYLKTLTSDAMPLIEAGDRTMVRLSNGSLQEIQPVTKTLPKNIVSHVSAFDVGSLIAYVGKFGSTATHIWLDVEKRKVVAIIDYHVDAPNFCQHRVQMDLKHSPEWSAWISKDRALIEQSVFAEFIEANIRDVKDPPAGDLFDVVSLIEGKRHLTFKAGYRASDGTRRIQFQEEQAASSGEMKIPNRITLQIPVYQLGDPVEVQALLRFRIDDGKVKFRLDFVGHDHVERAALLEIGRRLEAETQRPVYIGSPG